MSIRIHTHEGKQLPDTITTLDLAADQSFGDRYLERMRFTYVD